MSQSDTRMKESLVKEQLTLLVERELRYQLDNILRTMQELAKSYDIGKKSDKRSPLRNILVTATDRTASLEVIKNYIRYQIGRKEGNEVWKIERDSKKYGEVVIQELDGLRKDAEQIFQRIDRTLGDNNPLKGYLASEHYNREVDDLHLKLAQLYLGYLVREHTALLTLRSDSNDENQNTSSPDPMSRPSKRSQNDRPEQKFNN